jgi:two-component system, NarL family, response regulator LiaR
MAMARTTPIRVLIADDHEMVRDSLALFIEITDDMELVGVAENGEDAVALCDQHRPDVILMDLVMPVMNGVDATAIIKKFYPQIQVIGLTRPGDSELAHRVLQAGACECLFKDVGVDILTDAIRAAVK